MVRTPQQNGWRTSILLTLVAMLATTRADSPDLSDHRNSVTTPWQAGKAVSIRVDRGRAHFDLPATSEGSNTLVIVSALSKSSGSYPLRLEVHNVDKVRPPDQTRLTQPRRPRRDAPPARPNLAPSTRMPPTTRRFHLMVKEGDVGLASNYQAVSGRLRAVGQRVQVYVDADDLTLVDEATLRDVVDTFDSRIFPEATTRFGSAHDLDGDGRFTVLLTSWLTRLSGGKVCVDGFVRGADLDGELGSPFGNRCDMMYLSTGLKAGPHLRTVMAHEYTHAVSFSRKALAPGDARGVVGFEEEGWLDEALAHLVEDAFEFSKSNIDYRVSAFLSQPERYRLVVEDYYTADLFRSHGNRGATYLFLRWCVDTYGPGLLDELVRSGRRGVANLEAATGSRFEDLFRRWTVALYLSGLDPTLAAENAYRSVDPRGEIEDWILAGPRTSSLSAGSTETWRAAGTTTHYTLVRGSAKSALTIEASGPEEAELQVTVVVLPPGMGRPELVVQHLDSESGEIRVQARLAELDGTPVRLGALCWEPLIPASNPHSPSFRRGGMDMLGIAQAFGTSALPASGSLRSKPIPLAGVRHGDGPLIFKAVGTDPFGRRVAAWAIIDPSARETVPVVGRLGDP